MKKNNVVFKIAVLSCFSLAMIPSLSSAASLYRQLQVGSRGADVSDLQTFLSADSTVYPSGLITGYFGGLTRSAVIRFQARNGISQVGRVGPETMGVINSRMSGGMVGYEVSAPALTTLVSTTQSGSVVTFAVNTNVPTRAAVFYSTTPLTAFENVTSNPITVSVSGTGVRADNDLRFSHTINSLALDAHTTYYYMAVFTDANGEVSVSYPKSSFKTN